MFQLSRRKRITVVTAAALGAILVGGVATAYWAGGGAGSGTVKTKASMQALTIVQDTLGPIAPGEQIALTGHITNPNGTSMKLGILSGLVTTAGSAVITDFSIVGTSSVDGTMIAKNATIAWSGLTLKYLDSATVDQTAGMNATVGIAYTEVGTHSEFQYSRTTAAAVPGVPEVIKTCTAPTALVGLQVYQWRHDSGPFGNPPNQITWTTEILNSNNNGVGTLPGCGASEWFPGSGDGSRIQTPAIAPIPEVIEVSGWLLAPPAGTGWTVSNTRIVA